MARNKNVRRKRSSFRKTNANNPWAGKLGNMCPCQNCRGSRYLF